MIQLTPEQVALLDYVEQNDSHVFVTGRAGTGKSTLLSQLIETTGKRVAVCAPTGVAALNVRGMTIHSLFTFPLGMLAEVDLSRHMSRRTREILRAIDLLVIDEISMVSADLLDAMSRALGIARGKRREPFGGVQVVMFGDPYQLAPVPPSDNAEKALLAETYRSNWFFDAKVWREADLERYELTEIFRQRDEDFKQLLNSIRDGTITDQMLAELNAAGGKAAANPDIIRLATINETVQTINQSRLAELPGQSRFFEANYTEDAAKIFGRGLPVETRLELKVGAQVMFIKNDEFSATRAQEGVSRRWVNGTLGRVIAFPSEKTVLVEADGVQHEVGRSSWEKVRYEIEQDFDETTGRTREVVVPITLAEISQIPLRTAWAVTIHKSQGQSYDSAQIDLGRGAFVPGQTYVALSRVRSLAGLHLNRPIRRSDIMVDQAVNEFMSNAVPANRLF